MWNSGETLPSLIFSLSNTVTFSWWLGADLGMRLNNQLSFPIVYFQVEVVSTRCSKTEFKTVLSNADPIVLRMTMFGVTVYALQGQADMGV